jgi:hypothetical protein
MATPDERADAMLREHEASTQLEQPVPVRPPSRVPLADEDGFVPRPAVQAPVAEKPDRVRKVRVQPVPTQAFMNAQIVDEIGKMSAVRATKDAFKSASKVFKEQKQFQKDVEQTQFVEADKIELCNKLNQARMLYKDTLEPLGYKFKKAYVAEKCSIPELRSEWSLVKTMVGQIGAKPMLRQATVFFFQFTEFASLWLNYTMFVNMGTAAEEASEAGFFDEKIDRLILEYGDYFQVNPVVDYGLKLFEFMRVISAGNKAQTNGQNSVYPDDFVRCNADL